MARKIKQVYILFFCLVFLSSCSDLFAKQKAIHSVQRYKLDKQTTDFKNWLEARMDRDGPAEKLWEAGRLKRGFWVVQVSFRNEYGEHRFLYYVNLESGEIRGADNGASQSILNEFEASAPEFI